MQTRRDQVSAYAHQRARLVAALVSGQPDPVESPVRRDRFGLLASVAAGFLAIAVAVGLGVLRGPDRSAMLAAGTLLVDSSTGTRFLVEGTTLRPVANLASARLLTGKDLTTRVVDHAQLMTFPHGAPIGIPGGADSVPPAAALNRGSWRACALPGGPTTTDRTRTLLQLGDLAPGVALDPDSGLLVTTGNTDYLVWRGSRLRLPERQTAGLLYGGIARRQVPAAWIELIPPGPDLAFPQLQGRGSPGPTLAGRPTRIGDLFWTAGDNGARQLFVAVDGGLAALTPLDASLAQMDPAAIAGGQTEPQQLSLGAVYGVAAQRLTRTGAFPSQKPNAVGLPEGMAPCLQRPAGRDCSIGDTTSCTLVAAPVPEVSTGSSPVVVRIQPGRGALVRSAAKQPGGGAPVLVTDEGMSYRLPQPRDLGYDDTSVVEGPAAFVALIPRGAELSVAAMAQASAATATTVGTTATATAGTGG